MEAPNCPRCQNWAADHSVQLAICPANFDIVTPRYVPSSQQIVLSESIRMCILNFRFEYHNNRSCWSPGRPWNKSREHIITWMNTSCFLQTSRSNDGLAQSEGTASSAVEWPAARKWAAWTMPFSRSNLLNQAYGWIRCHSKQSQPCTEVLP